MALAISAGWCEARPAKPWWATRVGRTIHAQKVAYDAAQSAAAAAAAQAAAQAQAAATAAASSSSGSISGGVTVMLSNPNTGSYTGTSSISGGSLTISGVSFGAETSTVRDLTFSGSTFASTTTSTTIAGNVLTVDATSTAANTIILQNLANTNGLTLANNINIAATSIPINGSSSGLVKVGGTTTTTLSSAANTVSGVLTLNGSVISSLPTSATGVIVMSTGTTVNASNLGVTYISASSGN